MTRHVAALSVLLGSLAAGAHGLPLGGVLPFFEGGEVVGAATTWGVVLEERGDFLRVCEEAAGEARIYLLLPSRRVLASGDEGVLLSDDGGCTYFRPEGLGDLVAGATASPAGDPATVFVATRSAGRENGVFVSRDGGARFEATGLSSPGLLFQALLVSDDGSRVVASASDADAGRLRAFVSVDGGASYTGDPAALRGYAFVRLLGLGADGRRIAFAAVEEGGDEALLLSDDDLATAESAARFRGVLGGYAEVGDARLALVDGELWVEPSRGAGFSPREAPIVSCLERAPGDERIFGCARVGAGGHFLATGDGESWAPVLPFLDVKERPCPRGTPGRERCAAYLEDDGGPGDGGRDDAGSEPPPPPICQCGTGDARAPLPFFLVVMALAVVARRAIPNGLFGR